MSQAEASAGEGAQNGTNDADRLSQDADRAENLIRSLIAEGLVNTELAQDLHHDLVSMFGQMVEEHEEITAAEIALVTWAEVLRLEDLLMGSEEEVEEADTSTQASMEEALDSEDMELLGQPGEDDGQDAASPPNDPAFH